jgi:hypothetical protein
VSALLIPLLMLGAACGGDDDDAAPAPPAAATTSAPAAPATAAPTTAAPAPAPPPPPPAAAGAAAACAGNYAGTFAGDLEGSTTGTLDGSGRFAFNFGGEAFGAGELTVGPDLAVSGSTKLAGTNLPTALLDGALDATTCMITGTWESVSLEDAGTYQFTRTG